MKTKQEIRKLYKSKRSKLTDTEIDDQSLAIANQLLSIPIWSKTYYHLYLPIKKQKEVDTSYILHILQGKDKHILLSATNFGDLSLSHYLLTDTTKLKVNSYGIPEPIDAIEIDVQKIEVVFVPLLAYDRKGNRVGYGKGIYDRFLQKCQNDVIKIGLSFFEPLTENVEFSVDDQELDYIVTPNQIYKPGS